MQLLRNQRMRKLCADFYYYFLFATSTCIQLIFRSRLREAWKISRRNNSDYTLNGCVRQCQCLCHFKWIAELNIFNFKLFGVLIFTPSPLAVFLLLPRLCVFRFANYGFSVEKYYSEQYTR